MTSSYDIGVGRCCEIGSDVVAIRLDSVIAKKLAPDQPWRRSETSVLCCELRFCSERRPPQLNEELYLDSAALSQHAPATLDVLGDGNFRKVDLKVILKGMTPLPAPAPRPKIAYPRAMK